MKLKLLFLCFLSISCPRPGAQTLVKDIMKGSNGSFPVFLAASDSNFIFTAENMNGRELWVSDGTAPGTHMISDFAPGSSSSKFDWAKWYPGFGYLLINQVSNSSDYCELWRSDGTDSGTVLLNDSFLKEIDVRDNFVLLKGKVIFAASSTLTGNELWITDGTRDGTRLLKDFFPGKMGAAPNGLTVVDSLLYFIAAVPLYGIEICVSDGTSDGTRMAFDFNPDISSTILPNQINNIIGVDHKIYFLGTKGDSIGYELYATDGTLNGTQLVSDFCHNPRNKDSNGTLVKMNDSVFFITAFSNDFIYKVYRYDTRKKSLVQAKMKNGDSTENYLSAIYPLRHNPIFLMYQQNNGYELWTENPDIRNLDILLDFVPSFNSGCCLIKPVISGPYAYFVFANSLGMDIWQTNGENQNTKIYFNLTKESQLTEIIAFNHKLILFANLNSEFGKELYTLDIPAELRPVKAENAFKIYPNPVSPGSTLSIDNLDPSASVRLIDLYGHVISLIPDDGQINIPEKLPPGIYNLTIENRSFKYSNKLLIL